MADTLRADSPNPRSGGQQPMPSMKVVLIGFQEQENLGLGYLASVLDNAGFETEVLDFREGPPALLDRIATEKPLFVGFSVIFQYHVQDFAKLVDYLRSKEVRCHFTAGGHYPSLRPRQLLETVPEIDSIVLFEGESTLLALARRLAHGQDWQEIEGIAYRSGSGQVKTSVRKLIDDLDVLPFPKRTNPPIMCAGNKSVTLIASRGCVRNCSFCSIRKFYKSPPGKIKRIRSPRNVVAEMRKLHEEQDIRIFFFQDDDFPVVGRKGRRWVSEFLNGLDKHGLSQKILWKISCRTDEVESPLFKEMKAAGLFLVYLGIESGNPTGLEVLNKGVTVSQNLDAVRKLKDLDILYDYGFMLFDPSSTFDSVQDNIAFQRDLCGDGSSPAGFCKMVPYADTAIEKQLKQERRLKGNLHCQDYDFLDPRLDAYYRYLKDTFGEWMFSSTGLLNKLKWVRYEAAILNRTFPNDPDILLHQAVIERIVAMANSVYFSVSEGLVDMFANGRAEHADAVLLEFQQFVLGQQHDLVMQLSDAIDSLQLVNEKCEMRP